jgi:hypothetical protein
MKRSRMVLWLGVAAVALVSATATAPAETTVFRFVALPGSAATCKWFDDNINDRSIGAMVRQTDLIYNRAPLPPDKPVTVSGTATTALGERLSDFKLDGRLLCAGTQALDASVPEVTPSPPQ